MEKSTKDNPQQNLAQELSGGTYEIIANRLKQCRRELSARIEQLNNARREVFGTIENKLLSSERISTTNNCVPRDMIPVGNKFIFGYNVFIGLRSETVIEDVFSVYQWNEGAFTQCPLSLIGDRRFEADFKNLYKYYRSTRFVKFAIRGKYLYMVFRVGKDVTDVKTFKWLVRNGELEYVDNRSEHEYVYPAQHEFEWTRATQDMYHNGKNPHVSIEDRVFVETVGGDLTIKIEDNTETGQGIYSEPVENADQTLNDAEIHYAIIGDIIVLKILPYQEYEYRYFVFNDKLKKALRIDAIKDSCVLLPDNQGLIFSKGYYLQSGVFKKFEIQMDDMIFEKRIISPNGEDYLYVFYNRESGTYILLSYNIIEQTVSTPIVCHGFCFFDDGIMIYFKASEEAKKYHSIQVWQTPYYGPDYTVEVKRDSQLYKIGNKEIVKCMAECNVLIKLIDRKDVYQSLYSEIAKKAEDIRDSYFWLKSAELFELAAPLSEIKVVAESAIDEYEKVISAKRETAKQIEEASQRADALIRGIDYGALNDINLFVGNLSRLRGLRGEIISLKDLRYADIVKIEAMEKLIAGNTDKLSDLCVKFLVKEQSLDPYRKTVSAQSAKASELKSAADVKSLLTEVEQTGGELEMLTDIVSNLKISDATETITIIDNISLVYADVNKVKSFIKNKLSELGRIEGQAEFASQIKLIDQSVINYLDMCGTPQKCDEYLSKAMVQIETLSGKFADFEDFVAQLTEKQEELYNAFESRKVQLVSQRNQRTSTLMSSAERILKGIANRVSALTEISEINGYFASDIMIDKVRETIDMLIALGDSVKAEDLKNRLKTIEQETVRQLKDKQALYEDGQNIIRLGTHRFSVNKQTLEGTIVLKDDNCYFHLAGTGFFELIDDNELNSLRDVWSCGLLSENEDVYRGEYLAFKVFEEIKVSPDKYAGAIKDGFAGLAGCVKEFMSRRYEEGYVKGVHDFDAAKILEAVLELDGVIELLRYSTRARALANVFWNLSATRQKQNMLNDKIKAMGQAVKLFGFVPKLGDYINEIAKELEAFAEQSGLFDKELAPQAAKYLFEELAGDNKFVVDNAALEIKRDFELHIKEKNLRDKISATYTAASKDMAVTYRIVRDWVYSYICGSQYSNRFEYADEIASLLLWDGNNDRIVLKESIERNIAGLLGTHKQISGGNYQLNYCHFFDRLSRHCNVFVPRFMQYKKCKSRIVAQYNRLLHLDEFKPQVLTTFVRNRLIDKTYLPLIGDNLAKQIGAADADKRTDRQGMLLVISPPGYGKTTLMEYVANRLGLIFIKINGPTIGHKVTSIDPAEAINAACREELNKLNLAFEMGDNIMIYVDDIQHTNPEFLQKFISLCDAQRKIDGVYKGNPKTYDMRGKRVCVVMAGNPYTESGEKFRIPDMLSNRADVYNIGDIVGDNYELFIDSYIENSLTSNPSLRKLAARGADDLFAIIEIARTGSREGVKLAGNYSAEELNEYISVMKKLFIVREVVLKVNKQYMQSAAQEEAYRTEPPFLLQGSYRNMNRIAARVLPIMNDKELWTLINSSYEQDAQTLTGGAESNMLKFAELTGAISGEKLKRWEEIKRTFRKNLILGQTNGCDDVSRILSQLSVFGSGLDSIRDIIAEGVEGIRASKQRPPSEEAPVIRSVGENISGRLTDVINEMKLLRQDYQSLKITQASDKTQKDVQMLTSVLEEQFNSMERWLVPVSNEDKITKQKLVGELLKRFETMVCGYGKLIEILKSKYEAAEGNDKNHKRHSRE